MMSNMLTGLKKKIEKRLLNCNPGFKCIWHRLTTNLGSYNRKKFTLL